MTYLYHNQLNAMEGSLYLLKCQLLGSTMSLAEPVMFII